MELQNMLLGKPCRFLFCNIYIVELKLYSTINSVIVYRDAHIGAFSRRGDMEVLGYNMIEWLCGKLPWGSEGPPDKVHKQKQAFMTDPALKKIYPSEIGGN